MNSLLKMEIFLKRYQSVKQKEKMANLKFLEKVLVVLIISLFFSTISMCFVILISIYKAYFYCIFNP